MKKLFCMLLALGMIAVGAACGEETPSGNGGNNPAGEFDEIKGEQVSKEQWDKALQQFKTADNATMCVYIATSGESYWYVDGVVKLADNKIFWSHKSSLSLTENPREDSEAQYWGGEGYIGKIGDMFYEWGRRDDEDIWEQNEIFSENSIEENVTLGSSLVMDQIDLYLNYEEMVYQEEQYNKEKNAYLLGVVEFDEEGVAKCEWNYEIKIIDSKISNMKITANSCSSDPVEGRAVMYLSFTYGGVTIGDLPPLQTE